MKRTNKYLIIIIMILIVLTIGITYSYFDITIVKENNYEISTSSGNLNIGITNTNINIDNIIPIYDENYLLGSYNKEFSISNNGSLNGCLNIYLNFNDIDSSLINDYIKFKLISNNSVYEGSFKDIKNNKLLLANNVFLEKNNIITYDLYIWISYDENNDQIDLLNKKMISNLYVESYDYMNNSCGN